MDCDDSRGPFSREIEKERLLEVHGTTVRAPDSESIVPFVSLFILVSQAIHDFHQVGFLHRDIKPGNYCVGADGKADIIFLIDFGLARKYRLNNGTIRPPRQKTKMVGTPRYCPRASHRQEELARKDDFESWLFMVWYPMEALH